MVIFGSNNFDHFSFYLSLFFGFVEFSVNRHRIFCSLFALCIYLFIFPDLSQEIPRDLCRLKNSENESHMLVLVYPFFESVYWLNNMNRYESRSVDWLKQREPSYHLFLRKSDRLPLFVTHACAHVQRYLKKGGGGSRNTLISEPAIMKWLMG